MSDGQLLAFAGVAFAAFAATVFEYGQGPLTPFTAFVLGVVEGLTEYLPVSSTAHLLIVERLLGLGAAEYKTATDTYTVAIQIGAILAVLGVYRRRIMSILLGFVGRDPAGFHLGLRILVAFVPAAVVGLLFSDAIKSQLFDVWPIVIAWAVGGVFLLVWKPKPGKVALHQISLQQAGIIGIAQVAALVPGTSRSLATIVAALLVGLTMRAAVEFSFLLGLVTLSAATVYDLGQNGGELFSTFGFLTPLIGIVAAAVVASIAVRWLVAYLATKSLRIFGYYRVGAAILVSLLAINGLV